MFELDFIEDFQKAMFNFVSPTDMDSLWADGWRHFGKHFFRNRVDYYEAMHQWVQVLPLRINIAKFTFSKHQQKLLKRQKATKISYQPIVIDTARESMFLKHIQRFKQNLPESLATFLGTEPGVVPCPALECALYDEAGKFYAASYFAVGEQSISSIYATFDTDYASESPGLHTLLAEIQYAQTHHKQYVYLGYCYREASFYDYKKNFNALEYYDWKGNWLDLQKPKK